MQTSGSMYIVKRLVLQNPPLKTWSVIHFSSRSEAVPRKFFAHTGGFIHNKTAKGCHQHNEPADNDSYRVHPFTLLSPTHLSGEKACQITTSASKQAINPTLLYTPIYVWIVQSGEVPFKSSHPAVMRDQRFVLLPSNSSISSWLE